MTKSPLTYQKIRNSYLDKNGIPNYIYIYKFIATKFRKPIGVVFDNNGDVTNVRVVKLTTTNDIIEGPINFFLEDYSILFGMINFCVEDYFTTYNSIRKIKINFS